MLNFLTTELLIVALVVIYLMHLLVGVILLRKTENTRIEVLNLGSELIKRQDIDSKKKQQIEFLLGTVFSWKFVMIVTLYFATTSMKKIPGLNADVKLISDEKLRRFYMLHLKATLAASPIWAIVFIVVLQVRLLEMVIRMKKSGMKVKTEFKPTTVDLYQDLDSEHLVA